MSEMIYDNVIRTETLEMYRREREEMIVDIYESSDAVRNDEVMINTEMMSTERQQALQHTGRVSVKNRRHRSVQVCLCLLSVLLLTAVIVICVYFNNERKQLLTHNYNLTKEREGLLTHNYNLTKEREELLTDNYNLTEVNERLLTNYSDLLNKSKILTEEREKFRNKSDELQAVVQASVKSQEHCVCNTQRTKGTTKKGKQSLTNNSKLIEEKNQCPMKTRSLSEERDRLINESKEFNRWLTEQDWQSDNFKWIYYNFSFYFISSERKNWSDSRRDCEQRGANLVIINNQEEQEFLKKAIDGQYYWIGLSKEGGDWKWVDDTTLTLRYWLKNVPISFGHICALTSESGWAHHSCNGYHIYGWICEKRMLKSLNI